VIVDEVFPAEPLRGAIVVKVVADSPADQAGLEEGDRIVAVDEQELNGDNNLAEAIAAHEPGDRVSLTVERPGEESRDVSVTLGTHPDEAGKAYLGVEYAPFSRFGKLPDGAVPFPRDFGEARPFTAPMPDIEGLDGGAIVIEVVEDSPARAAGLQAGDIITAIEGKPLTQPTEVREAVDARAPGDKLTLSVRRQEDDLEITVTLAESPDEPGQAYLGVRIGGFFFSHKFEGIGPDEFRGIIPRFEFGWPFHGFGFGERPGETPETPDTSTTL
jgi:serine protease Do